MASQKYVTIDGKEHLVRDTSSMAVLLTDKSADAAYAARTKQINDMHNQARDINNLKMEMQEIKDQLSDLISILKK